MTRRPMPICGVASARASCRRRCRSRQASRRFSGKGMTESRARQVRGSPDVSSWRIRRSARSRPGTSGWRVVRLRGGVLALVALRRTGALGDAWVAPASSANEHVVANALRHPLCRRGRLRHEAKPCPARERRAARLRRRSRGAELELSPDILDRRGVACADGVGSAQPFKKVCHFVASVGRRVMSFSRSV